jgi:hypothetical protein
MTNGLVTLTGTSGQATTVTITRPGGHTTTVTITVS